VATDQRRAVARVRSFRAALPDVTDVVPTGIARGLFPNRSAATDTLIVRRSRRRVRRPTAEELERMKIDEIIRRNPGRTA